MIRFKNVSKVYPGAQLPALSDVTLNITRGEFVFLVGASGSGKSSFLRLILREERATTGLLHVLGQDLTKIRYRKIPVFRRSLGVVFQDFRLLANKTVFDNVAFTLKVIGRSSGFIQNAVPDVLRTVGLENKSDNFPGELSGGEQQRVAIARAVVNKPAILLADEPTGNLDPITSAGIMQIFERINAGGTTVVMATHEASIVNEMQKRVVEVSQGCIVRDEVQGEFGITTKLLVQDKEVSVFLSTKEGAAGSSDARGSCANNITGTGTRDTGLQGDVTQGYMTQGVRHSTNLNRDGRNRDGQHGAGHDPNRQHSDSGINSQDRLRTSVQSADTVRHAGTDSPVQYPGQTDNTGRAKPGQTVVFHTAIDNPNSQHDLENTGTKNTATDNTATGGHASYRDRHDTTDQSRSVQDSADLDNTDQCGESHRSVQDGQRSDDQHRAVPNNVAVPNNTPDSRVPGRMPNGHMLDDQDSDRFNTNYSITNNADISDSMLYGDASSDGVLSSTLMHADHIASGRGARGVSIVAAGARPHTPQPCTGQSHTDQPCDLGRLCDPHELPHRFTDERTNKLPTSQLHGLQLHGLQHLTNQGRCDTGLQGDVTQGVRHSTNLNRDDQRGANQHSNRQYSDGQYRSVQHSTVEESILEAEKLSIAARTAADRFHTPFSLDNPYYAPHSTQHRSKQISPVPDNTTQGQTDRARIEHSETGVTDKHDSGINNHKAHRAADNTVTGSRVSYRDRHNNIDQNRDRQHSDGQYRSVHDPKNTGPDR
ncbi:cell division ATP-binding protein FtsE [Tropheryma whipplei]|uniref:cell division ATP-binding protein FtsE n=2 Tax=Tropheryma whipplei TaxID=2039 RepID=UPI000000C8B7|nr:cell division ATP-binding protein FtsE [Tropheryma whipplei]CAD67239.1 cell division ATP-binding protein FtsE [Tropheryma whipplei TW08/27]